MKKVYDALNNIEAHLALHQLQQAGIHAYIEGEHLLGGMGELPAIGSICIMVNDQDEAEANEVINNWDNIEIN
ncbi:MAG: hypothetical protein CMQ54_04335 [Gammaproteobacteria bacterium]|nr:hypothetical protein [Gammaproteobacteria bacterium]|tara:strand:+ start:942 stop:1160 length:219 start_codon:yes stop_codon:yes gene_type:complete